MAYVLIATDNGVNKYKGNSIDTKPSDVPNGSRCFETDTRRVWVYDSSNKNPGTNTNWWPDYVDQEDFSDLLNDTVNDAQLGDIAHIVKASGDITGVTDTTKLQQALDTYKRVYAPDDLYIISHITIPDGHSFKCGVNTVISSITDNPNTSLIELQYMFQTFYLEDIKIDCNNQNVYGIYSQDVPDNENYALNMGNMKNIEIYNSNTDGIKLGKRSRIKGKDIKIHDCDGYGLYHDGYDSNIYNIVCYLIGKSGIYLNANNELIGGKVYHCNLIDDSYAMILNSINRVFNFNIEETPASGILFTGHGNRYEGSLTGVGRINATYGHQNGTLNNSLLGFDHDAIGNQLNLLHIRDAFSSEPDVLFNLLDIKNTYIFNNEINIRQYKPYASKNSIKNIMKPTGYSLHPSNKCKINDEDVIDKTPILLSFNDFTVLNQAPLTIAKTVSTDTHSVTLSTTGDTSQLLTGTGIILSCTDFFTKYGIAISDILSASNMHFMVDGASFLPNNHAYCNIALRLYDKNTTGLFTSQQLSSALRNNADGIEKIYYSDKTFTDIIKTQYDTLLAQGVQLELDVRLQIFATGNNTITESSINGMFKNMKFELL